MNSYKARNSQGWIWLLGTGIFILALMIFPMLPFLRTGPSWAAIMNMSLGLMISVPFIYIAFQVQKIKYVLHAEHLEISMGRLIHYKVKYTDINEVVKKDLQITLWSSMRFPGLALFKVPYANEGVVFMCATAASRNILLIKTDFGKYGITPSEENEFINLLTSKIL